MTILFAAIALQTVALYLGWQQLKQFHLQHDARVANIEAHMAKQVELQAARVEAMKRLQGGRELLRERLQARMERVK